MIAAASAAGDTPAVRKKKKKKKKQQQGGNGLAAGDSASGVGGTTVAAAPRLDHRKMSDIDDIFGSAPKKTKPKVVAADRLLANDDGDFSDTRGAKIFTVAVCSPLSPGVAWWGPPLVSS